MEAGLQEKTRKSLYSKRVTEEHRLCSGYKPHIRQREFHDSHRRFVTLCAGRRAGKTMAAAAEMLARIFGKQPEVTVQNSEAPIFARRPQALYWVVSATYDLLKEPTRYIFELLPRATVSEVAKEKTAGWRVQERRLWLPGDIEIGFRSAEDPLSLVGVRLDGVWIDEAARVKSQAWEYLRPALTDSGGWLIASTTPLGRNWVYDQLWRRGLGGDVLCDPEYSSITWTTAENPYINALELEQARRDLPDPVYRREYEASWDAFVGQIYPGVEGEQFEALKYREVVAGIDWGYASPGALVIVGVRADGVFDVLDEDYASGRAIPQWLAAFKQFREKWHTRRFFADPSAPMLIRECRSAGLICIEANNDVWEGIQSVQSLLHAKRLRIHSRCRNLLREMSGYRWSEQRQGGLREEPAPNQADHLCDSLRYVCRGLSRGSSVRALV